MRRGLGLVLALGGCAARPGGPEVGVVDAAELGHSASPSSFAPPVLGQPNLDGPRPLLHPIAVREGAIGLAVAELDGHARALAVIDGEPVVLVPGQAPIRDPRLGRGLGPDKRDFAGNHELLALGGRLDGGDGARLVYAEHGEHGPATVYAYVHDGSGWQATGPERRPVKGAPELAIETTWAAIVARDGALLGLRRHRLVAELWDYGDGDELLGPALAAGGRALAKAPRGFERLAGEAGSVPRLPDGWDAHAAVATEAGLLVALGFRHRVELDGDDGPARLLSWEPGAIEASVAELPGLTDAAARDLGLWASSDRVLVGGLRDLPGADDQPYLAIRDAGTETGTEPGAAAPWVEIPIELPDVRERVAAAASSPAGELWIVTGTRNYASEAPCPCLWRRPVGETRWQPVALAELTLPADAEPRWVHRRPAEAWAHVLAEPTWIEVPPAARPRLYPAARELAWVGDSLWVTAELGRAYPGASEAVLGDPRMVVYASTPTASLTELPATDRLFDERYAAALARTTATPGSAGCRVFNIVLAEEPDAEGDDASRAAIVLEQLGLLSAATRVEDEGGWARASLVYVGSLEGRARLVAEASASSPAMATALVDSVAGLLGWRPTLDCRPHALERAVERL